MKNFYRILMALALSLFVICSGDTKKEDDEKEDKTKKLTEEKVSVYTEKHFESLMEEAKK